MVVLSLSPGIRKYEGTFVVVITMVGVDILAFDVLRCGILNASQCWGQSHTMGQGLFCPECSWHP
jgi:hypothetical protein